MAEFIPAHLYPKANRPSFSPKNLVKGAAMLEVEQALNREFAVLRDDVLEFGIFDLVPVCS